MYLVQIALIGGDEDPDSIYGPFRTAETAERFAERCRRALSQVDIEQYFGTGAFMSVQVRPIHKPTIRRVRETGWLQK